MSPFDFVFKPWTSIDKYYATAASELDWSALQRACKKIDKPRVLVDVDLFVDFKGAVVDSLGRPKNYRPKTRTDGVAVTAMTLTHIRGRLYEAIVGLPNAEWFLLADFPDRARNQLPDRWTTIRWPENVWLGTTVRGQADLDARVSKLVRIPATKRMIRFSLTSPISSFNLSAIGNCFHEGFQGRDREANHRDCMCHIDWAFFDPAPESLLSNSLTWTLKTSGVPCYVSDGAWNASTELKELPE